MRDREPQLDVLCLMEVPEVLIEDFKAGKIHLLFGDRMLCTGLDHVMIKVVTNFRSFSVNSAPSMRRLWQSFSRPARALLLHGRRRVHVVVPATPLPLGAGAARAQAAAEAARGMCARGDDQRDVTGTECAIVPAQRPAMHK